MRGLRPGFRRGAALALALGRIQPQRDAIRAEVVTMMMRADQLG